MNRSEYEQLIAEVNTEKERLMTIMWKLEEAGYKRKAKSLDTIIARIEMWQHTRP